MKHPIEPSFEYANEKLRLTAEEKALHRQALLSHMRGAGIPVRSPYMRFLHVARYAFAVLAVIVVGGAGTAFAAEGSLPGDLLYPVKIGVIEPVQVALAVTPDAKADVETSLVSERLDEIAEVTADDDREVDPEDLAAASSSLAAHVDAAQSAIKTLARRGDVGSALQANSDLTATLDSSTDILNAVSDDHPGAAPAIDGVVTDVENALEETDSATPSIASAVASSTDSADVEQSLEESEASVEDLYGKLAAIVSAPPPFIDADDLSTLASGLSDASTTLAAAHESADEGATGDALVKYEDANRALSTLDALVDADAQLDIDVVGEASSSNADEVPADSAN
jgi:hypothetical protein